MWQELILEMCKELPVERQIYFLGKAMEIQKAEMEYETDKFKLALSKI